MKIERAKKFAAAATLSLSLAYGLHAFTSTSTAMSNDARTVTQTPILQARGIVTFGGYALNASFTPDGRILCFDISAVSKSVKAARADECPVERAMRAG